MIARFHFGSNRILICLILFGLVITSRPASAHGTLGGNSVIANQGLDGCSGAGKALYDCVASVLDRMGSDLPGSERQTIRALSTAAVGLRAAVNTVQALSAIARCQAAIAGALRQAKAISVNNSLYRGWGTPLGLEALTGVLAHAAKLIQTKG